MFGRDADRDSPALVHHRREARGRVGHVEFHILVNGFDRHLGPIEPNLDWIHRRRTYFVAPTAEDAFDVRRDLLRHAESGEVRCIRYLRVRLAFELAEARFVDDAQVFLKLFLVRQTCRGHGARSLNRKGSGENVCRRSTNSITSRAQVGDGIVVVRG